MFNEIPLFLDEPEHSIALFIGKHQHGNHTGILIKTGNDINLIHLAWHCQLGCEPKNEILEGLKNYSIKKWVKFTSLTTDPKIIEYRLRPIIQRLEKIYKRNIDKIPYGFNFKTTRFSEEFKLELGEGENGLTCATFIASFFSSVAVNLIDLNSWSSREPEDSNWKIDITSLLSRTGVPFQHIAKVVQEELNYRVKPEEIAVASFKLEDELPADFNYCSIEGNKFNLITTAIV